MRVFCACVCVCVCVNSMPLRRTYDEYFSFFFSENTVRARHYAINLSLFDSYKILSKQNR